MSETPVDQRLYAPAALRNRQPILDVLIRVLPKQGRVLEIASGTGEHVTFFAQNLPGLSFQPSDADPAARASIVAWTAALGLTNVAAPMVVDAAQLPLGADTLLEDVFDGRGRAAERLAAILTINMVHISPWAATVGLVSGAAQLLAPGGVLYLYGPYRRDGRHTAPSNAEFDRSLRNRNPNWGVRDLEAVEDLAANAGFQPAEVVEMPANNLSVVFRR